MAVYCRQHMFLNAYRKNEPAQIPSAWVDRHQLRSGHDLSIRHAEKRNSRLSSLASASRDE
jgi:hypothetical protein